MDARVRKLALLVAASAALLTAAPAQARPAAPCGLPNATTWWIDYADGNVPFWQMFARPGHISAAANMIFPPQIRARGADTVYWDMYLKKRVGTPTLPADPAVIVERANKLFDYAATSSNCSTPLIAENELFGAGLVTPWSDTNAQYRANVLLYLRTIAARGGRAFLLVNSTPYTDGEAGDWWRSVAEVADIVREVYFPAPSIYQKGAIIGSRTLRNAMRKGVTDFTAIGIPPSKLGIMLGFQTDRGQGGREGLERLAWYETVKWQALAARQVASELRIRSVWSWGWANFGTAAVDPDKEGAACVWLWARSRSSCNGPAVAGPGFKSSLTEGQIRLPGGAQCTFAVGGQIGGTQMRGLQAMTGDREVAFTALLARAAASRHARVTQRQVIAAERAVIGSRFRGSAAAYRAALRKAHASPAVARGVIADQLREARIAERLSAPAPSSAAVSAFYLAYPDVLARRVEARPAPSWLGGRVRGLALSSIAPAAVFGVPSGRRSLVRTMDGSYAVRPMGEPSPLGTLPLDQARSAIASVLRGFARGAAFERWSSAHQSELLRYAICRKDDLPAPGVVDLATYLPFLQPNG